MSKKFKFASAVLSASLLVTPVSGLISQYNNVAKAEEENKIINSKYIEYDKNNINNTDKENIIGEDRSIIGLSTLIGFIGYGYSEWVKPYQEEWELVENTVNGWVRIQSPNSRRYYWFYKENGNYKRGWHWDSNYSGWYYFYDVTLKIGEPTFTKVERTITVMYDAAYNSKWLKLNNKWYEFEAGGKLIQHSGWRKYNNKWLYHLPGDYGAVADQGMYIDGTWYNFDSNGYWV